MRHNYYMHSAKLINVLRNSKAKIDILFFTVFFLLVENSNALEKSSAEYIFLIFNTFCLLGNCSCFLLSDFFSKSTLQKFRSGIPSENQTNWILIMPNKLMGLIRIQIVIRPDLSSNCLQKLKHSLLFMT